MNRLVVLAMAIATLHACRAGEHTSEPDGLTRSQAALVSGFSVYDLVSLGAGTDIPEGRFFGAESSNQAVVVRLRSRSVRLDSGSTAEFMEALANAGRPYLHGMGHLPTQPTSADLETLGEEGVEVLFPLQGRIYRVRVHRGVDLNGATVSRFVRALALFVAQDKVNSVLWNGEYERLAERRGIGEPVVNDDGSLNLVVRFHSGLDLGEVTAVLDLNTRGYEQKSSERWRVVVSPAQIRSLASDDLVRWIDVRPTYVMNNHAMRGAINANQLNAVAWPDGWVYGLGGSGIQVGVFDKGIDESHGDFTTMLLGYSPYLRVKTTATNLVSLHGTQMAGIIAGNGRMSSGMDSWGQQNTGFPMQYAGVAPGAELIDIFVFWEDSENQYYDFITQKGLDISNHSSTGQQAYPFGEYSQHDEFVDNLVSGNQLATDPQGTPQLVPPRLQVHSAGNCGAGDCGSQVGYFSTRKQMKNTLVIGDFSVADNRVPEHSGLGPTYDGRIKPDVVAPGSVTTTAYCDLSTANNPPLLGFPCSYPPSGQGPERRDFYLPTLGGTSGAAAVDSGLLALVLQQYQITYGGIFNPPLPSTLRGIVIHSAEDVSATAYTHSMENLWVGTFPGPDFTTGFGFVDAKAATELVANRLLIEGSISTECDERTYSAYVSGGSSWKVTLTWDDYPADPASLPDGTAPRLINDLDLILIDPDGQAHYPWALDQVTINPNTLTPWAPDAQTCGTDVQVQRAVMPDLTEPATDDVIPAGSLVAAVPGRDHLNNVEQVIVQNPTQGVWTVKVLAFRLRQTPQSFSLIGVPPNQLIPFPFNLRGELPDRGAWMRYGPAVCEKFPDLCGSPNPTLVEDGALVVRFRGPDDRAIMSVGPLCHALGYSHACQSSRFTRYSMTIGGPIDGIDVGLVDSAGEIIAWDSTGAVAKMLEFSPQPGARYYLIIEAQSAHLEGRQRFPIEVEALPD